MYVRAQPGSIQIFNWLIVLDCIFELDSAERPCFCINGAWAGSHQFLVHFSCQREGLMS